MVDLRFVDLLGIWQHFTLPVQELSETLFTEGAFFDGSSVKGFRRSMEWTSAHPGCVDRRRGSGASDPTMSITCSVVDPFTKEYTAGTHATSLEGPKRTSLGPVSRRPATSARAEFYIFNSLRFDQNSHSSYYFIDSDEGIWNSGAPPNGKPNLGYHFPPKGGLLPRSAD